MKRVAKLLESHRDAVLADWVKMQEEQAVEDLPISREDLRDQSSEFFEAFTKSMMAGDPELDAESWDETLALLRHIALKRGQLGMSPTETATFVLSLKEALFSRVLSVSKTEDLLKQLWSVTQIVDRLGLYVMDIFIEKREDVIERQQEELLEISTPVVELWDGILALPIIGTLDSARAQAVMEGLLKAIVDCEASIAIIDITGVPAVDTQTAQHLLRTVTAAELMGAECYVSGVRPQIAQTIVQLGLDFGGMRTKATLMSALKGALARLDLSVEEGASS